MESLPNIGLANPFSSEEYLHQLLKKAVAAGASDVHFKVGQPPGARVRGGLVYFRLDRLTPEATLAAAAHLLRGRDAARKVDTISEVDCSYEVSGVARFRVNIYRQRGSLAIVLRIIPFKIPSIDELELPPVCRTLAEKDRGLVLCVGAAGNGKSTTLAAMIDHMNHTLSRHVVTVEDPIEYLYEDDRCSVSQREIGIDTPSFAEALRAVLRQDPDVIQVGEIRDSESMDIALKAAETGHLVLTTLHTPDVARTMNRVLALSEGASDRYSRTARGRDSRHRRSASLTARRRRGRGVGHGNIGRYRQRARKHQASSGQSGSERTDGTGSKHVRHAHVRDEYQAAIARCRHRPRHSAAVFGVLGVGRQGTRGAKKQNWPRRISGAKQSFRV